MNAPHCCKTDAVLAHHLDGDLDPDLLDHGYGFACGESLHQHLRECAACQTALVRARRLDAALATAAGADVERHPAQVGAAWPALVGRWLTAATAAPRVVDQAPSPEPTGAAAFAARPPRVALAGRPLTVAAAALLVGGLGCWLALGGSAPGSTVAAIGRLRAPHELLAPSGMAAPASAGAASVAAEPARPSGRVPDAGAPRRTTGVRAFANAPSNAPTARELGRCAADPDRTGDDRAAALRTLLQQCRPFAPEPARAWRALLDALAACGDRSPAELAAHRALLDLARDSSAARTLLGTALDEHGTALAARVPDLAAVAVAARLGTPEADRSLRRAGHRDRDLGEVVAAALRCGVREAGGATLLLDLWDDLAKTGALAADEAPAAWFRGQPAACYRELAAELAHSRVDSRRRHCLLGLGSAPDLGAAAPLLERLASPHLEEAHAAAFALAQLPPSALRTLQPASGSDHEWLLRAALARADLPAARGWIDALALTPTERELLHRGPLARFPEVAGWFRDRAAAGD